MSSDVIPAATLVIFRPATGGGPPDLLMLERARAMAFAGGALVLPGGRVDPADHALAALLGADDPEDAAARIAAIRETIEEAGLPIGLSPPPSPARLATLRAALLSGEPIGRALAAAGCDLDLAALEPFARWRPDHPGMRIYDTRFFLAALPFDAPAASVDGTENVRLFWGTAAAVLAEAAAGRAAVIYPTRRNLERLATLADHAAAVAHARAFPQRTITPWTEARGGLPHLCIPDDLGYPVTAEPLVAALRG